MFSIAILNFRRLKEWIYASVRQHGITRLEFLYKRSFLSHAEDSACAWDNQFSGLPHWAPAHSFFSSTNPTELKLQARHGGGHWGAKMSEKWYLFLMDLWRQTWYTNASSGLFQEHAEVCVAWKGALESFLEEKISELELEARQE